MDFEIRELSTIDEFAEHERLQREIWGSDQIDVPVNLLAAGARHGAIVLGAYVEDEMIGILYGFPALTHGRVHHHSHMLGVLPPHRRRGIGLALKLRQRELVLAQGLDLVTWTVDPLEVANNILNFGSLGVICRTYLVNAYGEMDDAINRGLPSDRLEVEWWVERPLPERSGAPKGQQNSVETEAVVISEAHVGSEGLPSPVEIADAGAELVAIEVPADFRAIRQADPALALTWRLHLRALLTDLFAGGYTMTGCIPHDDRARYLLRKDTGAAGGETRPQA